MYQLREGNALRTNPFLGKSNTQPTASAFKSENCLHQRTWSNNFYSLVADAPPLAHDDELTFLINQNTSSYILLTLCVKKKIANYTILSINTIQFMYRLAINITCILALCIRYRSFFNGVFKKTLRGRALSPLRDDTCSFNVVQGKVARLPLITFSIKRG